MHTYHQQLFCKIAAKKAGLNCLPGSAGMIWRWIIATVFLICFSTRTNSQAIAINTDGSHPHPSAILDIKSNNRGLLVPRLTAVQRLQITAPAKGLLVYDTDSSALFLFSGAWTK